MESVLITGTSSGIGRATATEFARRGVRVFAAVREPKDLHVAGSSDRFIPITLDVSDAASVAAAAARIDERLGQGGLAAVVNNAGIGAGGPLEHLDLDRFREVVEVNLFGALRVLQAVLPQLRRHGDARVINVSSVQGRVAMPFLAPYACSKFALEALSDSLRLELAPWRIRTSVVQAGMVNTAMLRKAEAALSEVKRSLGAEGLRNYGAVVTAFEEGIARAQGRGVSPERVARTIYEAYASPRPRPRYLVGVDARIVALLRWLLPDRGLDVLIGRSSLLRRARRASPPSREGTP